MSRRTAQNFYTRRIADRNHQLDDRRSIRLNDAAPHAAMDQSQHRSSMTMALRRQMIVRLVTALPADRILLTIRLQQVVVVPFPDQEGLTTLAIERIFVVETVSLAVLIFEIGRMIATEPVLTMVERIVVVVVVVVQVEAAVADLIVAALQFGRIVVVAHSLAAK